MASLAVIARLCLLVAVHAPAHRHLHPRAGGRLLTLSDLSVAGLTLHLPEDHMPPMGKENVIGLSVNPLPGNLLSFFIELSDFLFLWILCEGLFVTLYTDGERWHPGERLGFEVVMTCVTF